MITSLSGSFSGLIAYRNNTTTPFRGTFDSRFQEFDEFGLSAAIDALSNVDVANDVSAFIPLGGSFVGVPPGTVVAVHTSDTLRLTIDGDGFFTLVDPSSGNSFYTRNVSMRVGGSSTLSFGIYEIQPSISLPPNTLNFFVGADGLLSVTTVSDPVNLMLVGQIQIATFTTPPTDIGGGLFVEGASPPIIGNPGDPGPPSFGTIKQGFIEQVNTARNDVSEVVLRIDATFTQDSGPEGTFAVVYEAGNARLIGSMADINALRADTHGYLTRFDRILQNATGDPNLSIQ